MRGAPLRSARLNRAPAIVALILALGSVVSLTVSWRNVTGESEPLALAVVTLGIALGLLVVGYLDAALFRPDPQRLSLYVLGLAGATATYGTVVQLGTADHLGLAAVGGIVVLLCVARPVLGAVQASRRPRGAWVQLLLAIGVWNVALAIFVWLGPELPSWNRLIWPTADQIGLFNHARDLLHGRFKPFGFMLGFPVFSMPLVLLVDHPGLDRVAGANLLNAFFVPINALLVLPSFLWALVRAACSAIGVRVTTWRVTIGIGLGAAIVVAYALLPPSYATGRYAEMVPRRLLGIVFGPESLGFVALAGGLWLLARRHASWSPVPAGIVMGLVLTLNERFIPGGLLLLACLLLQRSHRRRALVMSVTAFATFTPQLLYFRFVYGRWLFPNRTGDAWSDQAGNWVTRAQARFGIGEDTLPARLSLDYVPSNGIDMLQAYWPALILLLAAAVVVVWKHPRQWPLWTFCCGHAGLVFLLSAMYINPQVTYRYNAVALPALALLLIAALGSLETRLSVASRKQVTKNGDDRVGAKRASMATLLMLGLAWGAIGLRYHLLRPSTLRVATIAVGNRLAPDFRRILVSETPVEDARLRRGGDFMGLLTVPDFTASAVRLDGADAELFPASRLEGANAPFYRRRMERVPEASRLVIRPQLFRVRGPPIVAVVHGWRRSKALASGAFHVDAETADAWRGTLPEAFWGRFVSLDLLVRHAVAAGVEPQLRSTGDMVPCTRLRRRNQRRVWFRCLRFRSPVNGELRLHASGLEESVREIDYAVRAWSRPPAIDAVSWD